MDLLVVSSYPSRKKKFKNQTGGIAWHTQATLKWLLKKNARLNVTVLANVFDKKDEYVDEDGVKVKRIWNKNDLVGMINVLKEISKFKGDRVLFPFEFFIVGGLYFLPVYVLILYISRLLGKEVTLIFHNVVSDVDIFEPNKAKTALYNSIRKVFYELILFPCSQAIVFEQELKRHLGNKTKIKVIPLANNGSKMIPKIKAKNKLELSKNKKYILFFGFLSVYKGIDKLLEIWPENSDYQLIVAGGRNPAYEGKPDYEEFIKKVKKLAKKKKVIMTGFLPEEQIKYYFSACDAVIFPYQTFISSSGPLSFALSHEKPILMSRRLSDYYRSADFKKALDESRLKVDDVFFKMDQKSLEQVLNGLKNASKYKKFAQDLRKARSWNTVSEQFSDALLTETQKSPLFGFTKLPNFQLKYYLAK